jgi:carboxyl-terminal processing protease
MSRMTRLALLLIVAGSNAASAQEIDFTRLGTQLCDLVRVGFYDAERADAWAARHANYAHGIIDRGTFVRRTRELLAELHASHTGYYTPDDVEFYAIRSIFHRPEENVDIRVESIGLDVRPDGFVRRVFAGGPAVGTGMARGDRIVAADGASFHPVLSLRGKAGIPVRFMVQSESDGPARPIEIVPYRVDPKAEWLKHQHAGTHIVQTPGGKKALVVPYYCGAGEEFTSDLEHTIGLRQAEADVMVLDARGGWGGSPPDLIARFDNTVPVMRVTPRGQPAHDVGAGGNHWRKPLVVLIDAGTRSGKEVFAYAVKASRRGRLVGQTTAGAVLAGSINWLHDGSLLFLAVADVEVDGKRLEAVGVAPDVEVADDLPFAEGRDSALDAALREADHILVGEPPIP